MFGSATVVLAFSVTLFLFADRALGLGEGGTSWARQDEAYRLAGELIRGDGGPSLIAAVNNPPCFYYQAHMRAVVIPQGGPQALQAVVERYGVTYVVVDRNLPNDLKTLFAEGASPAWLTLIGRTGADPGALGVYRVNVP